MWSLGWPWVGCRAARRREPQGSLGRTVEVAPPAELAELERRFDALSRSNLALDLTRGKPAAEQLALSNGLDGILDGDYRAEGGTDVRNYGVLRGIPEARRLGARFLETAPENVIAAGNSSLTLMFHVLDACLNGGVCGPPWRQLGVARIICPVPGYDRHFTLSAGLGVEMATVPMTADGPDMDRVEALVAADPQLRGIWCVPKYANPTGCVYSPETVRRIAELPSKARGPFVVFWDNAYAVHDFVFPATPLTPILPLAEAAGCEDRIAMFASTSKVTFATGGIAFLGGSKRFLADMEKRLSLLMIGADKVNQLRHARFLEPRLDEHMRAHADLVRPKFEAVQRGLERQLGGTGLAEWTQPTGGYFVSLDVALGLAAESIRLAGQLGVALTPAGATFPHGHDPEDRNIRIAPTFATEEAVATSIDALALCVKLAAARRRQPK